MLAVFNCRNLGLTGKFIRTDYTVDCRSGLYSDYLFIATLGTLLYPLGMPLLFYLVIRHRDSPLLRLPSLLLYENFAPEWMYYEVYDLIRKLLLTSVMSFVAAPGTASQCLYLLLVDMCALILLAYARPYANKNDDFLSASLIAVECGLFLLALIIVSGIADQDNYHTIALYNTSMAAVLVALLCVVPWTYAMKFKYIRTALSSFVCLIKRHAAQFGIVIPDLSRYGLMPI